MSGLRIAAAVVVMLATAAGCGGRPAASPVAAAAAPRGPAPRPGRDKFVAGAMSVLSRLDDFDEVRGYEQVFDRLNQWSHAQPPGMEGWSPDSLLAALPERLRAGSEPMLAQTSFAADGDVAFVRDRRWLADIATAVRGDAEGVEAATRLFTWTVRSLAVVGDPPMVPSAANPGTRWLSPGEILLAGRASAAQRAWMFIELATQAGLDAVMLATGAAAQGDQRPWLPAVVVDGEAYLFEPTFGMPVPGPGGRGVATARQAADDPTVLAALSFPDRPYPVAAGDVAGLSVLVVADPPSLSRRMAALDKDVAVAHGVRLAVDADAVGRRALAALPGTGGGVALWAFPWETAARRRDAAAVMPVVGRELAPLGITLVQAASGERGGRVMRPLFAARVREFRGEYDGADGAKAAYLAARPSRETVAAAVASLPPEQAEAAERLYERMKEDATYWLGILTLAEGENEAAVDYLGRMLLQATPDSRWADAARTNLAQAYVGLGRIDDAIRMLREDGSPQRFGSRLLADRLERQRGAE